jgi:Phosphatidylglycerophosphate synthase
MVLRHLPNIISLMRLLLVPPVVFAILAQQYGWGLLLFFVAGLSDGVDGFLAKRYGWQTPLGGFLDPLADKLLMVSSIVALAAQGHVPLWLAAVVLLRDLVIVVGALCYRVLVGPFDAAPTTISKINTLVQILLVLAVMADRVLALGADLSPLFFVALVMAMSSGIDYVLQWSRRARDAWRKGGGTPQSG